MIKRPATVANQNASNFIVSALQREDSVVRRVPAATAIINNSLNHKDNKLSRKFSLGIPKPSNKTISLILSMVQMMKI